MHSAIFEGRVSHRRKQPVDHAFNYRLFMVYLDLAELPSVFKGRWFWSTRRPAPARFRREDHVGDPAISLEQSVRDLVEAAGGSRPSGPIRLLTHLSYFGYCFNPVSFYYCFDRNDEYVETIVAEVNNTPWGERHCYVLTGAHGRTGPDRHRYRPVKRMHVSPFMAMDVDYDWKFNQPDSRLTVFMGVSRQGEKIFDASLDLERTEMAGTSMARVLVTHPCMTLKIILTIHWQALRLWLKRCPVHDHPDKARMRLENAP